MRFCYHCRAPLDNPKRQRKPRKLTLKDFERNACELCYAMFQIVLHSPDLATEQQAYESKMRRLGSGMNRCDSD